MHTVAIYNFSKNPNNKFGRTTLHLAAEHGHLEICQLICENISSLNSRSDCGRTPLHQAAIEGHLEIPHAAAREGLLEIYKYIAERVKEINPEDRNGHYEICRLIYAYKIKQMQEQDAKAKLSNPDVVKRNNNFINALSKCYYV